MRQYSFKTEIEEGEECFYSADEGVTWKIGSCDSVTASLKKEKVIMCFYINTDNMDDWSFAPEHVASKDLFLEWQSRLMDLARDSHKYKGDMDKMFGPANYDQWIPFYKEGLPVANAYLIGMGLVEREVLGED